MNIDNTSTTKLQQFNNFLKFNLESIECDEFYEKLGDEKLEITNFSKGKFVVIKIGLLNEKDNLIEWKSFFCETYDFELLPYGLKKFAIYLQHHFSTTKNFFSKMIYEHFDLNEEKEEKFFYRLRDLMRNFRREVDDKSYSYNNNNSSLFIPIYWYFDKH